MSKTYDDMEEELVELVREWFRESLTEIDNEERNYHKFEVQMDATDDNEVTLDFTFASGGGHAMQVKRKVLQ